MSVLTGHISQIIGPVVDVHFQLPEDQQSRLPSIHEALQVTRKDGSTLTIEVQQHLGEDTVRTVAMDSTDGLRRGMEVQCTDTTITMPVGAQIRGRVMNVTGGTIDGMGPLDREGSLPSTANRPNSKGLGSHPILVLLVAFGLIMSLLRILDPHK